MSVDPWWPSVPEDVCKETVRGKDFEEIYCIYPFLKNFYME
jgi:hypothetical protein